MQNKQVALLATYFFVAISMTHSIQASLQSDSMKLQDNRLLHTTREETSLSIEEEIVEYSNTAFASLVKCWSYKQAEISRKNKEDDLLHDFYTLLPEDMQHTGWAQQCVRQNVSASSHEQSVSSKQSMSSMTDENISQSDDMQSIETFIQEHDSGAEQDAIDKLISADGSSYCVQDCLKTPILHNEKNNKNALKKARRKQRQREEKKKQDDEDLYLAETACVLALQYKKQELDQKIIRKKQVQIEKKSSSDTIIISSRLADLEISIESLLSSMVNDIVIEEGGYRARNDKNFLKQYNVLYTLLGDLRLAHRPITENMSTYLQELDQTIRKGMQHFCHDDSRLDLDYKFFYDNNKKFTIIKNLLKISKNI